MSSLNNNDIIQTTNNNVIKIPYSDNQEESDTSLHINGFTIIEINEEKNDCNYLIQSFEEEQRIGKKEEFQLKSKAKIAENYYANYQEKVVPNVNCSKCLLDGFTSNELLYFKDRKSLISYLKYCFLYLKKSLFMNHNIYMNNKYDLFQINSSFYNGWKFGIPKTLCKSCFIQMINIEYLIYNIKNIICDYDQSNTTTTLANKNTTTRSFINSKRRRISRNKKRKIVKAIKTKASPTAQDILNDINGMISPIVIPISENEKVHKKRRSSNSVFKRRKIKIEKKKIKNRYNENVVFDPKNNILIINKKSIPNYLNDDDSTIINSIINDNKKFNINKNKEKERENSKQSKKKDEKLKFHSNESESLSNTKTVKKEKKYDNNLIDNIKDINGNKNKMNNINKNNSQRNLDTKSTIIINNINNAKNPEINMNKVGLIQINDNKYENNLNIFSDNSIKNNINQNFNANNNNNNNNILINNLNNNNFNYNNNFLNYPNIYILRQLPFVKVNEIRIMQNKINEERNIIINYLFSISLFAQTLIQNLEKNNVGNVNQYKYIINYFIGALNEIRCKVIETASYMMNSKKIINSSLTNYQGYFNDNNLFNELLNKLSQLEKKAFGVQKFIYDCIVENIIPCTNMLREEIDKIIG